MRFVAKWGAILLIATGLIIALGFFVRVTAPAHPLDLPLLGLTVVVDPGHGGIDPGCHRDDILEKGLALQVGLVLAEILEGKGATVHLTRTEDIELSHLTDQERTRHRRDLRARVNFANDHGADVMLSLHVNTAGSSQMGGAMLFYHGSSPNGKRLATSLLEVLGTVVPGNQNGALPANFFILRHSTMPAVLVEMGFLSNAQDRNLLTTQAGQQSIAQAIANGLEAYVTDRQHGDDDATTPTFSRPLPLLDGHHCLTE